MLERYITVKLLRGLLNQCAHGTQNCRNWKQLDRNEREKIKFSGYETTGNLSSCVGKSSLDMTALNR